MKGALIATGALLRALSAPTYTWALMGDEKAQKRFTRELDRLTNGISWIALVSNSEQTRNIISHQATSTGKKVECA